MTTRVTVETSVGQRASVPEFSSKDEGTPFGDGFAAPPLPEMPTLAFFAGSGGREKEKIEVQPSPAETGSTNPHTAMESAVSPFDFGGVLGTDGIGTNDTSVYPSPLDRMPQHPATSASRPLPYIPTDTKSAAPPSHVHRVLQETPNMFDDYASAIVHEDAGVRFSLTEPQIPRRELPPPYRYYGA